jgi:hypothetical protein
MSYNVSSILEQLLEMFLDWSKVFPSRATRQRAVRLALGSYMNPQRKTITNAIVSCGREQQDWSADYKLFSRSNWELENLFEPVQRFWIGNHLERGWANQPLISAIDTTNAEKTGKKIPHTQRYRDPMSPYFYTNLQWGQRFLQISGLVPSESLEKGSSRGLPTVLKCCPRPRKPGRKASVEEEQEYEAALKEHKLSRVTVAEVRNYREHLDRLGGGNQLLLMIGDSDFTNREIYTADWDRVAWLTRTRKDMAVYFPWSEGDGGMRRKYRCKAPTPQELRADENVTWKETDVYVGEHLCRVKYKSMGGVLWKKALGAEVRLLVINGLPYLAPGASKKSYRLPAYLTYIGPSLPDEHLVQWYIWRTQIELNFRDEKQLFGLGHAQVWSEMSVHRCPAFMVAMYSCLLAAAIKTNGHQRGDFYLPLPKWNQKESWQRPSTQEILKKLRAEIVKSVVEGAKMDFEGFIDESDWMRSPQKHLAGAAGRRFKALAGT